ncbi:IQ motif, EF-hand binding site-containing protein [Cynara cardunculus var. scolymus]|uniref:IQ motif, EF-hand binding site-containing protein n=1 Tax=Cynara cardunculus var. scolymus TaxID=59895 RepID=A0A103YD42_CYNCS|nr:IQ motif, EF-hand binding site-containing protein [Cynara cardunculus var. scolymus]
MASSIKQELICEGSHLVPSPRHLPVSLNNTGFPSLNPSFKSLIKDRKNKRRIESSWRLLQEGKEMGKKGWLSAVKRAVIRSYSKDKKGKRSHRSNSRKSRHGNQMMSFDSYSPQTEAALANPPMEMEVDIMQHDSIAHANIAMVEEPADLKQPDDEQIMQPDSTTDMEEEPCVADDEVIPETSTTQFSGKSKEEIAAIKIQTVYRGHMARKDWRVLRARRRLRVMIKGQAVKRQTASTLMCMQTMARVQSQVRSRRIRMAEVNKDLQRQLLQKTKKALDRVKSSEQVEASLRKKRETAERREKALAYIHTHQQIWRNSLRSANPTSTEPWGWSWLDRWNAVRPWEPATSNTESPSKPALLSASSKGSLYSMQSIRGSPNDSLRSSSVANASKGSTKSTKVRSKISTHAPGRLVSGKQGGSSSRLGVVSTKKQISSSGSSSGLRRSMGPRRTKF